MHTHTKYLETSGDLLIERYKHGVRLAKPSSHDEIAINSVSNIFSLPVSACLTDCESRFVKVNEGTVKIGNALSAQDMIGKTVEPFSSKEFGKRVIAINNSVIDSGVMKIAEETGARVDDFLIQTISFKYPWFSEDKLIGMLCCSIKIDSDSIQNFADTFMRLTATGLLGNTSQLAIPKLPSITSNTCYFSKREIEVLSLLTRGKTAKEIGLRLDISRRTVEHHIENMKIKSACRTKSELIEKYLD
jgi:DNA-binding CsgD family transcriptional regulator